MKVRYVILYVLLLINWQRSVFAQTAESLDSMKNALSQAAHDTVRIQVLTDLYSYHFYDQPDLSLSYIKKACALSEKVGDKHWKVDAYNNLAYMLRRSGQFDESIEQYTQSLKLARSIGYKAGIIESLQEIGNNYCRKADYSKAREYFNENLKYCQEIGDKDGLASSYNNLGNVYTEEGDYAKALESYIQSSEIYKELKNNPDYAVALGNVGMAQTNLGYYDKAIEYYTESRSIAEKSNDTYIISWLDRSLGVNYKNLKEYDKSMQSFRKALQSYEKQGELYEVSLIYRLIGNLHSELDQYHDALDNYRKSIDLSQQINDSSGYALSCNDLADLYFRQENFHKALEYALQAEQIGKDLINPSIVMNAESNKAKSYSAMGNYKKAYESYVNYSEINDSLSDLEKNKQAQEIEARFQNEKKEREIERLNAQNELHKLQLKKRESERNYILGIAALIFVLGVLIFRLYRMKDQSNKKLLELDKLKTHFFANISHEFRTPLTLILGWVEEKIDRQSGKSDKDELQIVKRNANRLLNLINQLLDLSRIDARSLELKVEKGDINEHLRLIAASFTSLADHKDISFSKDISLRKSEAWFDPEKLEKIIYNLLSNAFKFTPHGGAISIRSEIGGNWARVSIKDTGCGITKEEIAKIFDRFYQVGRAYNLSQQGTGIGLALVKELVELHRGNISVNSQPSKGSEFVIKFPIDKKSYHSIELADSPVSSSSPSGSVLSIVENSTMDNLSEENDLKKDAGLVMLVEDDIDMLNFVSRSVGEKYRVIQATNGGEGFEKALTHVPDLIVTDLMMPGADGIELCHRIRSNEVTSHIPVIMLTAKADMDSKIEGLQKGVDDYMTKPFEGKELMVRIRNLIAQRDHLRKKYSHSIYLQPSDISLTSGDEIFLKKAMEIIEKNMDNSDFSINDFQKEMGYSRMQLHRKLKALTNCSTSEFIRTQRLKRAAQFLTESNLNVSEVCFSTGFNNLSYFTRSFRSLYGMAPKEYLNQHNKLNISG